MGVQRRRASRIGRVARVRVAVQRDQAYVQRAGHHVEDAVVRAHRGAGPDARAPDARDRVRRHRHGALARVRQPLPAAGPSAGPEQHRAAGPGLDRVHGRPARGHARRQRHREHQQRRVRPATGAQEAVHGPEQHQLHRRGGVRAVAQAGGARPVRKQVDGIAVPVRVPRAGVGKAPGHAGEPLGTGGPGRVRRAGVPRGARARGQPHKDGGRQRVFRVAQPPPTELGGEPIDRARRPHVQQP